MASITSTKAAMILNFRCLCSFSSKCS